METLRPATVEELAEALADASRRGRVIELGGAFTKRLMAGPVPPAEVTISTSGLRRTLQYEPQDLTISVEAGMPWCELAQLLAANGQMVPLDPPFASGATVGGVVAANCSGPRRRLYGTARDVIIGMKFVTLEGKAVQSGGMVVKNVAGLDMAKLMIGSFGTLAAIAVVNFKLTPVPEGTRTFIKHFASVDEMVAARDSVMRGVLQPAAVDGLNPLAAESIGLSRWCLLVQANGSPAVLERYARELAPADTIEGRAEKNLWNAVREFTPRWLRDHPEGGVVRISSTVQGVSDALRRAESPVIARAGTGVAYVYVCDAASAEVTGKSVLEFAPDEVRASRSLWNMEGSDFDIMKRIKHLFDPKNLLNPGRLYGRI